MATCSRWSACRGAVRPLPCLVFTGTDIPVTGIAHCILRPTTADTDRAACCCWLPKVLHLSRGRSPRFSTHISTHNIAECARLARADARDCVFFMHGVLDTSMGWVSNGITGSQAFAAYDQGFDVWLGNSRANPPRDHIGAQSHSHTNSGLATGHSLGVIATLMSY